MGLVALVALVTLNVLGGSLTLSNCQVAHLSLSTPLVARSKQWVSQLSHMIIVLWSSCSPSPCRW